MKHCCFMFFDLAPGVRGLGVFFFFVNLVLLLPVVDDWMELLTPPAVPAVPPADSAVPAAGPLLLRVYRRHRRPLLAVSAAAVGLGLLVNVLLVGAAGPSRRPGRRRLLLLPWLAWHAALFGAATLAVLAGLVQWSRGRLVLSVPAALIGLGLLPLCWYWFAAVLSLFRNFPTSPPPSSAKKKRKKTPAAGGLVSGGGLAAGSAGGGGRAGSPGALGSVGSLLGPAGGDVRTEGAAEAAVNGARTELPPAGNAGLLQATLGHAVWYWAAINAAVMDEQERHRQQELLREQELEQDEERRRPRGRSWVSLESLRSAWRRLTVGSESVDDPAEPAPPGPDQRRPSSSTAAGRRLLLRRQHACVEEV